MHLEGEVYYILISYEKEYLRAKLVCIRNNIGRRQNISHGKLIPLRAKTVVRLCIMCLIDKKTSPQAFSGQSVL